VRRSGDPAPEFERDRERTIRAKYCVRLIFEQAQEIDGLVARLADSSDRSRHRGRPSTNPTPVALVGEGLRLGIQRPGSESFLPRSLMQRLR